MKKDKTILLFSDLEGTILKENDGDYSAEDMYAFLVQIDKLQQLTGANVHLHLVSPFYKKDMEKIMDRIDREIVKYNRLHPDHDDIPDIESATYSPENHVTQKDFLEDRLVPLKKPISSNEIDTSAYGKSSYVRTWCDTYNSMGRLMMAIYCGNDFNDLDAMEWVRKQKSGFVVCPANSRPEAKAKAVHASEKTDLRGITEGIMKINEKIAQRVAPISENEKMISTIDE